MTLPFVMPDPFSFQRRVFAHYFYPFPLSINNKPAAVDYYNEGYLSPEGENNTHLAYGGYLRQRPLPVPVQPVFSAITNMQTEVRMAIARGITGFTFDILSFLDAVSTTNGQVVLNPTGHLFMMLQAAAAVDPRFSIIPMLDMSSMSTITQTQVMQLIAALNHPSLLREPDGRLVIAAFNPTQPLAWWQQVFQTLNASDIEIAFIPIFLGSPTKSPLDAISIGIGGWGTATPQVALASASYMTPILTQQFRPKNQIFWESCNFDTFRNGWQAAIAGALAGHTQYAQIITWSDFSESGQVQPYTDASLAPNIGTGFYDLTAYYATWFMSGVQPEITKDMLYWCYRKMQSTVAHPNQADPFKTVTPPVELNSIECLAFLTEPGTLIVNGISLPAEAGITSFKVPALPGNPMMALQRNGSDVHRGVCPVTIYGPQGSTAGTLDMTYWSGNL